MTFEVDMSELAELARSLINTAPAQAKGAVRKATAAEGRQVKARAQSAAPRDRPWLATQGIRQKTFTNPDDVATSIYTVPDPEGRPVGFFVEYGTSRTPPQPFMQPALTPAETSYPAAVLAVVDPFSTEVAAEVDVGVE